MKKVLLKLVTVSLAAAMLLSLVACGKTAKDDPNIGVWKATEASTMGITLPIDQITSEDMTVELKPNGVVVMSVNGERGTGTWVFADGIVTFELEGQTFEATIDGNVMTMENLLGMGVDFTFVKEEVAPR